VHRGAKHLIQVISMQPCYPLLYPLFCGIDAQWVVARASTHRRQKHTVVSFCMPRSMGFYRAAVFLNAAHGNQFKPVGLSQSVEFCWHLGPCLMDGALNIRVCCDFGNMGWPALFFHQNGQIHVYKFVEYPDSKEPSVMQRHKTPVFIGPQFFLLLRMTTNTALLVSVNQSGFCLILG